MEEFVGAEADAVVLLGSVVKSVLACCNFSLRIQFMKGSCFTSILTNPTTRGVLSASIATTAAFALPSLSLTIIMLLPLVIQFENKNAWGCLNRISNLGSAAKESISESHITAVSTLGGTVTLILRTEGAKRFVSKAWLSSFSAANFPSLHALSAVVA